MSLILNNLAASGHLAASFIGTMPTYAEWDPLNTDPSISITGDGLRAEKVNSNTSTKATIGKYSGKWYFTVEILQSFSTTGVVIGVGFGTPGNSGANSFPGFGGGAGNGGAGYNNVSGGQILTASPAVTGIVGNNAVTNAFWGVGVNFDDSNISFYRNGVLLHTLAFSANSTPISFSAGNPAFPWVAFRGGAVSQTAIANFGQSEWIYPVPDGFNPGWYNEA